GLTRALIAQGASRVIAVERDDRATAALGEIAAHYPGRLTVIEGDALEIDWRRAPVPPPSPLVGEGWGSGAGGNDVRLLPTPTPNPSPQGEGVKENAARIVSNLPYNIATALLVRWLSIEPWPPWYDSLVLMFQREVADRIVAPLGTKQFGRLAV